MSDDAEYKINDHRTMYGTPDNHDDLNAAEGCIRALLFSLPLWFVLLLVWIVL